MMQNDIELFNIYNELQVDIFIAVKYFVAI